MSNRRAVLLAMEVVGGGPAAYTISGTVYDADGTTAVSGATVALGALSAVSAGDGTYTISDVPAGTSGSMTCTKTGYSWSAITISAMSGNLTSQNYTGKWWTFGGSSALVAGGYQGIGAASLAASYINLKNPGTNNLSLGVEPAWTQAGGWAGDAATVYLKTGIVANQNAYGMLVRFSGATSGDTNVCGWNTGANERFTVLVRNTTNDIQYRYATDNVVSPKITSGTLGISGGKGYRNGVAEAFTVSPGSSSKEIYLLAMNQTGAVGFFSGSVQAFIVWSSDPGATIIAGVHAAMMALTESSTP